MEPTMTVWQTVAVSLISGTFGAVLVCLANLVIKDKVRKREAIKYFLRYYHKTGPGDIGRKLLSEMYVLFSRSPATKKRLQQYREAEHFDKDLKALLKAMCHSACIKYNDFLAHGGGKHG